VRDLLARLIAEVNETLPDGDRVRCFAILPSELTHDGGALTAVGKLRRGVTAARFDDLVDEMYASTDEDGGQ
jgi:long-subunit acyl-CoA synthetase (AMP-forming)